MLSQGKISLSPDSASERSPARDAAALKFALTGLAAASIEWYDFFLYVTAAAIVFPTVFFPASLPPFVALLYSFSSYAVGFLARPIGAVLFGHIGDRAGRKVALAIALITMGAGTMLIGCLPPYRIAGAFSVVALVLLRFAQGLAVGGQWGGAVLLATENAPQAKRGLYGSIAQAGVPAGVLLANLAFLIVNRVTSPAEFMAYGWRVIFLLSIVLLGLAAFIHFRVQDTAVFRQFQQSQPSFTNTGERQLSPVLEALRLYPRSILTGAGAFIATNLTFYILIAYVVAYGTSVAGLQLPRSTMLGAVLIGSTAAVPTLFFSGWLSDRYGRRGIFVAGLMLMGGWAFILFPLIDTRSFLWITMAIFVGLSFLNLTYGPLAAQFAELFATRVRYSAASLAYQLGSIAGGALAPIIAASLYARYRNNVLISAYIAATCGISLICTWMLRETHRESLTGIPGAFSSK